jgi:hypothetical protein
MGVAFHTLDASDGLENFNTFDRVYMGTIDVTYAGGANTATATVTWTEPVPFSAANPYAVYISFQEQAFGWITSATALGFTLNVIKIAGNLTGGTASCLIVA